MGPMLVESTGALASSGLFVGAFAKSVVAQQLSAHASSAFPQGAIRELVVEHGSWAVVPRYRPGSLACRFLLGAAVLPRRWVANMGPRVDFEACGIFSAVGFGH